MDVTRQGSRGERMKGKVTRGEQGEAAEVGWQGQVVVKKGMCTRCEEEGTGHGRGNASFSDHLTISPRREWGWDGISSSFSTATRASSEGLL